MISEKNSWYREIQRQVFLFFTDFHLYTTPDSCGNLFPISFIVNADVPNAQTWEVSSLKNPATLIRRRNLNFPCSFIANKALWAFGSSLIIGSNDDGDGDGNENGKKAIGV